METITIKLTHKGVKHICHHDQRMRRLIEWIGPINVHYRNDYFASLVRSIVAQLISRQAADAVFNRVVEQTNGITPESISQLSFEQLKSAGLTNRKTDYIQQLAEAVATDTLNFEQLTESSNEEIVEALTKIKGIGQWTAEVFLILSLKRENVLARGDVALQRAASWLYGTKKNERKQTLINQAKNWEPYQSIGCLYLWEIIHLNLIEQYDNLEALPSSDSSFQA